MNLNIFGHIGQRRRRRIFECIYTEKSWGDDGGDFYSGTGSDEEMLRPYSAVVTDFIARKPIRTVVDLGCGDFRAGRTIARAGIQYIGVDIVPALVQRNQREFSGPQIEFRCLDAVTEDLPAGDLCIIKQVLQHLSNSDIARILRKATMSSTSSSLSISRPRPSVLLRTRTSPRITALERR